MTSTRVAFIAQKRKALKTQITRLSSAVSQNKVDAANARLRLKRVTELFNAYEDLHDELALLDENNEGIQQLSEIQDKYYEIATQVEGMSNGSGSHTNDSAPLNAFANSTFVEKQRSVQLPIAELPKFNGDVNKWLSFKNTFMSMIDARTDLNDLNKFLYLKNSLTDAASYKIAYLEASAENYKNAWDLLKDSYEKKRILVSKQYDAIIDIAPVKGATAEGLSRIVDEVRQHLNMLDTMQVKPDHGIIVRILERTLPADVREKWEESLSLDELPSLDQFCKFVSETAFRVSTLEQEANHNKGGSSKRRCSNQEPRATKARRLHSDTRAFVTTSAPTCACCRENHAIFKCPTFEKLSVNKRWDVVKSKRLCRNCLRAHSGKCKSTHCKLCERYHHTLLHSVKSKSATPHSSNSPKDADKNRPSNKEPSA